MDLEPYLTEVDENDTGYTTHTVKEFDPESSCIETSETWVFYYPTSVTDIVPKPGDILRVYGRFGRPIRGLMINGRTIYYRTEKMQEIRDRYIQETSKARHRRETDSKMPEYVHQYNELPPLFRRDIDAAMRDNPNFWYEYLGGPYQLFIYTEAYRIHRDLEVFNDITNEDINNLLSPLHSAGTADRTRDQVYRLRFHRP